MKPFGQPALTTYQSAAEFLEEKNGAGWRLVGWTVLRAGVIAVPFLLLRVEPKRALIGSALASAAITGYVIARIARAKS